MMNRLVVCLVCLVWFCCSCPTLSFEVNDGDGSYVVQIHSSRDGFVQPEDLSLRSTLMTIKSGKRFECFLPAKVTAPDQWDDEHSELDPTAREHQALVEFGRIATKKIRPKCLQFAHSRGQWIYEVCPGMLVRKINLATSPIDPIGQSASSADPSTRVGGSAKAEILDIATYESDSADSLNPFNEFAIADVVPNLFQMSDKRVYTQVFRVKPQFQSHAQAAHGKPVQDDGGVNDDDDDTTTTTTIKLQFICPGSLGKGVSQDDAVAAIWRTVPQPHDHNDDNNKDAKAFLVISRVFCHARFTDSTSDDFSVASLLSPLVSMNTCVKRNEGWWTYEFCFGQSIRQYHREPDGQVTGEYLLGQYNHDQNKDLQANNGALVSEHIDGTHDAPRPAFMEIYTDGTACNEFEKPRKRTARVFYYCGTGSGLASHYILSVKETQTCAYTIKVSTPSLCDHPHFINEEQTSEDNAEIVHCLPLDEQEQSRAGDHSNEL